MHIFIINTNYIYIFFFFLFQTAIVGDIGARFVGIVHDGSGGSPLMIIARGKDIQEKVDPLSSKFKKIIIDYVDE